MKLDIGGKTKLKNLFLRSLPVVLVTLKKGMDG